MHDTYRMCNILAAGLQMETGAPFISIINGLTPIFRGTIVVHNKEHGFSMTLEFRRNSAWKSLAFKDMPKDEVSSFPLRLISKSHLCMNAMHEQYLAGLIC